MPAACVRACVLCRRRAPHHHRPPASPQLAGASCAACLEDGDGGAKARANRFSNVRLVYGDQRKVGRHGEAPAVSDPRVCQKLGHGGALPGVLLQHAAQHPPQPWRGVRWEVRVAAPDARKHGGSVRRGEGARARHHAQRDARRPNVCRHAQVAPLLAHLGRVEGRGAGGRVEPYVAGGGRGSSQRCAAQVRNAEVEQLDLGRGEGGALAGAG